MKKLDKGASYQGKEIAIPKEFLKLFNDDDFASEMLADMVPQLMEMQLKYALQLTELALKYMPSQEVSKQTVFDLFNESSKIIAKRVENPDL
jgi:hypothetical protein